MRLFHSRREAGWLLAGLLAGAALALLGAWLLPGARRLASEALLPEYAAHDCAEAAPPLAEGAQAWVTNPRPAVGDSTRVCARLVVDGTIVRSAAARPIVRYPTTAGDVRELPAGTHLVDGMGLAQMGFYLNDAVVEAPVDVEVQISPDESFAVVYTAHTTFTYSETPLGYPPP